MSEALSEKVNGIVEVHTARRIAPVVKDPGMKDPHDIVTYVRKNKVKKIGEGEDDFILEEVIVEDSRVNRQAYIDKDANDVGVLNILEKVRRSGDLSLTDQIGLRVPASGEVDSLGRPLGPIEDYTNVPHNVGDVLSAIRSGSVAYSQLKSIFGDVTFEALAKMSPEELSSAVTAFAEKIQKSGSEGGDK